MTSDWDVKKEEKEEKKSCSQMKWLKYTCANDFTNCNWVKQSDVPLKGKWKIKLQMKKKMNNIEVIKWIKIRILFSSKLQLMKIKIKTKLSNS